MIGYSLSLFWIFSILTKNGDAYTTCSNHSDTNNIPVVTFCSDSQATNNIIAIDGFYADTIQNEVCTCIAKSKKQQTFLLETTFDPLIKQTSCGSEIRVASSDTNGFILNCTHSGSFNVTEDQEIMIVLEKTYYPYDTKYCLLLGDETTLFDVTCYANLTLPQTTETPQTDYTTTDDALKFTKTKLSGGDNKVMYITVGIGCGCAVIIMIIIVFICKRSQRKQSNGRSEPRVFHQGCELQANVWYTAGCESNIRYQVMSGENSNDYVDIRQAESYRESTNVSDNTNAENKCKSTDKSTNRKKETISSTEDDKNEHETEQGSPADDNALNNEAQNRSHSYLYESSEISLQK